MSLCLVFMSQRMKIWGVYLRVCWDIHGFPSISLVNRHQCILKVRVKNRFSCRSFSVQGSAGNSPADVLSSNALNLFCCPPLCVCAPTWPSWRCIFGKQTDTDTQQCVCFSCVYHLSLWKKTASSCDDGFCSQLVSEKVGGAEGTKLDEDFRDLERVCPTFEHLWWGYVLPWNHGAVLDPPCPQKADVTSKAVLDIITKTSEYLQPNPATRAKLTMLSTVSKMRGQVKSPGYPQPEGLLGECMTKYGREMGEETNFGENHQASNACFCGGWSNGRAGSWGGGTGWVVHVSLCPGTRVEHVHTHNRPFSQTFLHSVISTFVSEFCIYSGLTVLISEYVSN